MAGTFQGASAPTFSSSIPAPQRAPHPMLGSTRTLRMRAAIAVGKDIIGVHNTRREGEVHGVIVTLSNGEQCLNMHMVPAQARTMARALIDAAESVELLQRNNRGEGASQALAQEGGAA